ncbi:TPA: hypothetical protein P7484_005020 [Klebsiella pneumoniae]|uniref:hypothetical protein n=1 Tax=Klebsiella pneumoniae TaxID=573 RepID=UPI0013311168|nr:hypothetical protein [Klebsiella pneumoniae]EIX9511831.1 hypothetical protein [Klebsiella pneumoniae]MBC4370806.1 hypothetical protein [Klebsiella pneumoniae]MBK0708119.1 hypothetical protein [Klebsiella pneumoniae]MBS2788744.1 hypothetical protein [Klebsiella pneumoniae]MCE0317644.1 hypothetical protein [Klebsiella pneumoniae]
MHTNNIISGTPQAHIPRPGKRSAAGQDTADTVAIFVPDGGSRLARHTVRATCR